mgnify:CR=1 FL=1
MDYNTDFTLRVDNGPDLSFTGGEIATVTSETPYKERWTVLRLYETSDGQFVAQSIGRTRKQREHDRYNVVVCADEDDVRKFFGYSWLAKDLYDEAGIDYAQEVQA